MWIFTPGGLLMPASLPSMEVDKVVADPKFTRDGYFDMQVRGRVDSHLTNFIRDYMEPQGMEYSEVEYTPQMDYNVRFYCKQEDFAKAVALCVMDIDFLKFKPTAERYTLDEDGKTHIPMYKDGKEYHGVLNSIWGTVTRLGSAGGVWGTYSPTNPNGFKTTKRKDVTSYGYQNGKYEALSQRDRDVADFDDDGYGGWWNAALAGEPEFESDGVKVGMSGFLRSEDLSETRKQWEDFVWPQGADDEGNATAWTSERDKRVEKLFLELMGVPEGQWDEFATTEELDDIESFGRDHGLPNLISRYDHSTDGVAEAVQIGEFENAVSAAPEQKHQTRKERRAAERAMVTSGGGAPKDKTAKRRPRWSKR
jgi:hypothetical protein